MERRSLQRFFLASVVCALLAGGAQTLLLAQEPAETAMRVDLHGGVQGAASGRTVEWSLEVPSPAPETVPVEARVVLESRLQSCLSNPAGCGGGENFRDHEQILYGCADDVDNDADGLIDNDDPDCIGVTGWSLSVETEGCFGLHRATVRGTIGDIYDRPPGMRDPEAFNIVQVVDPERNGGREGAVSAVLLRQTRQIILPPIGEWPILRLLGSMDGSAIQPEGAAAPCLVRVLAPDEQGLIGSGQPVVTAISVRGISFFPETFGAAISLALGPKPLSAPFLRGDVDGDGEENITDGIVILRFLFRGGAAPGCMDAADSDDTGTVEVADAIRLFNFLFLGGEAPPAPGLARCGPDPTDDDLACGSFAGCST